MKKRIISTTIVICILALALSGCGGATRSDQSNSSSIADVTKAADTAKSDEGSKEITIMVPNWAEPADADLKTFMDQSGITVKKDILGWDEIHDKISIAGASNSAPADVMELDWSWVGEFNASNWLEPLTLKDEDIKEMPIISSFTVGGKILGVPYSNDFRMGLMNKEYVTKAGIATPPANWDEMVDQCVKIKADGIVKYPLNMTLQAAEATTTTVFWLTLSRSGEVFNEDGSLNKENVLSTLKFLNDCIRVYKIIDPAAANMKDIESFQQFLNGANAYSIGTPGTLGQIDDPKQSKIVKKGAPYLIPGREGVETASVGLPEAVAISRYSKGKEAAMKFIDWFTGNDEQVALFSQQGTLPSRISTIKKLIDDGKVLGGDVLLKQAGSVKSPFPKGIPLYYAEMSTSIYTAVNQMAQGQFSPEKAVETIDSKIKELMAK